MRTVTASYRTLLRRSTSGAPAAIVESISSGHSIYQYPAGGPAAHPVRLQSTAPPKLNKSSSNVNDESSILSSATSYLTALRLRAVSALTTSLTDVEREEILGKLNAVDKRGAEVQAQKSRPLRCRKGLVAQHIGR